MSYPEGLFIIDRPPMSGYLDDGPAADGPVVVLVHGTLDRGNSFRRTMRRLEDVRVVTYDRRGYQESRGAEPPVGVDRHIEDLLGILAEIGGSPVVVGHSLGGLVALGATMAEPGRVSAVGAFEAPIRWIPVEGGNDRPAWMAHDDPAAAVESFFRGQVGAEAWDRLEPAARADRLADGPALITELASIGREPLFDVTELRVPAVFGGGGDSDRYHKEHLAWLAEHVPGAEMVEIAGAGHGAHLTHPDAFARFVRTTMARAADADPLGAAAGSSDG